MEEIIIKYNRGIITSNEDLFEYIQKLESLFIPFVVFNISCEEKEMLTNGEKVKADILMAYDSEFYQILVANMTNELGAYYIKNNELIFDENDNAIKYSVANIRCCEYSNDYKIYTTKTYDDVINHYKKENNNKVLIKR